MEKGKKNFGTVMLVGVILLCINIVTLTSTDISRLVKQWNREYIVERYGVIVYQLNDIVQSAQSRLFSYFGYDEAAQKFITYYSNKDTTTTKNKYTGIYEGKNIVFVHMESMMSMFINLEINGEEVTPNLNKLTQDGLYFKNFYPQISVGTSSDSEFTLNTSLMPALSGTVFVNYYDRNYVSIEKLLKEKGYYTFSMHGNNASMWNRSAMHKSLGYDTFYSKEYFDVTSENTIGLGISDHDFFEQMIPYLKTIEEENENYMGTIITLTNHTPWDGGDAYGDFSLTLTVERVNEETGETETVEDSYLEDTRLGNYIRSAHYADQALGEFINSLYENDLFDNTVVVFYGDHDAKLTAKEYNYLYNYSPTLGRLLTEEDEGYYDYDYYENELNRKTPLIIWTKDKKISKTVDYNMGMIDVLPTIGNMMGFSNPFALGHDIFNIKNDNIIVFPNGNFLTESVYYNNSKSEYKVLKESAIIDETYIQECKDYAEEILELSNDIIVYDLINTEGDKITSESSSE
jgi:phosphoglycerol transferase MdoB-like AlkP superfamily enzyme